MSGNIVVMARGDSLSRIKELEKYDIDTAIIINRFQTEIQNKDIFDFLKKKHIIHMLAIQHNPPCYLSKRDYMRLDVDYCVVNRTLEEVKIGGKLTDWMEDHPAKIGLENYNINMEVKYLPDDINEVCQCDSTGKGITSSGLLGVVYATYYLKSDNIYTIGIDFHELPYYATKKMWDDPRRPSVVDNMKKGMIEWVNKTPDKKYHILTNSSFRFEAPNIEFL